MSYERPKDINTIQVPETARPENREIHRENMMREQNKARNTNVALQAGLDISLGLLRKKLGMHEFSKESLARSKKLNDQVASFGTPYDDFDLKSNNLMNSLVQKHNEISGVLDRGEAKNPNLANAELLKIEGMVDQYAQGITDIMAASKVIEQAMTIYAEKGPGAAGTLSVTGAMPAQLNIIDKIRRGGDLGKHIDIDHDGTNIILTDLSDEACKNNHGNCPVLNLGEFHKALLNENNPYIKLVPDISKELTNAYDSFMKNNKGDYNDSYTNIPQAFIDENKRRAAAGEPPLDPKTAQREIAADKEIALINSMKGIPLVINGSPVLDSNNKPILTSGMFEGMISKYGESIWEDMMPTKTTKGVIFGNMAPGEYPSSPVPVGDTKEYKEYYEKFKKPMIEFLATKSLEDNATDLQRVSIINKTTNKAKNDPNTYNPKGEEYKPGEKAEYDKNRQDGKDDFYNQGSSRLSKQFITTSNVDQDEQLLKNARVGDTVILSK